MQRSLPREDLRTSPFLVARYIPTGEGLPIRLPVTRAPVLGWGLRVQGAHGAGVGDRPQGAPGGRGRVEGRGVLVPPPPFPQRPPAPGSLTCRSGSSSRPRPGPAQPRVPPAAEPGSPGEEPTDGRTDARTRGLTGSAGAGPRGAGERPHGSPLSPSRPAGHPPALWPRSDAESPRSDGGLARPQFPQVAVRLGPLAGVRGLSPGAGGNGVR